jgi:hypothetical protein
VDKLTTANKAKVVFVAKDPAVTKGAGEDVEQISVQLDVAYGNGNAAGAFAVPATSANGWVVNKSTVAKFVNKDAPGGPTEAKVAVVKPSKLLKLVGKGLGDIDIDILGAGDPAGPVHTAFCVTNGGEENCHCSEFTGCIYKSIAGGTGAKLVCKSGTGEATCSVGAPLVCCDGAFCVGGWVGPGRVPRWQWHAGRERRLRRQWALRDSPGNDWELLPGRHPSVWVCDADGCSR